MRIARANREGMQELTGVHGGAGAILFNSLWDRADFETPFAFVHCAILLPGGGIGYHRHDDGEEIFKAALRAYATVGLGPKKEKVVRGASSGTWRRAAGWW